MGRTRTATGLLTALLIAAAASGCGVLPDVDTRPASTVEEYAEAVAALPAVDDAALGPDREVAVDIDETAGYTALRVTSEGLFDELNDHRYPSGRPQVSAQAGDFDVEVEHILYGASPSIPQPTRPSLEALDFYALIAGVARGTLTEEGQVRIVLDEGEDPVGWSIAHLDGRPEFGVLVRAAVDAADADAPVEGGQAARPRDDADEGDDDDRRVRLSAQTVQRTGSGIAEMRTLRDAAESAGGELTGYEGFGASPPDITVGAGGDADPVAAVDALAGTGLSPEVGIERADSSIDIGEVGADSAARLADYLAAEAELVEAGAQRRSLSLAYESMRMSVPDADALRSVAAAAGSPSWPLASDVEISIALSREDMADPRFSRFAAAEWPDAADSLAALWEAGYVGSSFSTGATGADADVSVEVAGPVLRGGDELLADAARPRLIGVLRGLDWDGVAGISFDTEGILYMESTSCGAHTKAYNSLHDYPPEPHGLPKEFLEEWDASATC